MARRGAPSRRRYGQVPSSSSMTGDDGDGATNGGGGGGNSGVGRPSPTSAELPHESSSLVATSTTCSTSTGTGSRLDRNNHERKTENQLESTPKSKPEQDAGAVTVTVLDTAHSKFLVKADPSWTVARFKAAGARSHGVPPSSQRLVYMGRLLDDTSTLDECGLDGEDRIVHLFPKPNVVLRTEDDELGELDGIASGGRGGAPGSASAESPSGTASAGGAHVPQIFLDANEATSPVLVLSSQEIFEAMHRVKLLSFLLLIMSSMELLTLFSIMMGGVPDTDGASNGYGGGYDDIPPGDPTDTGPPSYSGGGPGGGQQVQMRTWRTSDWADLAVSVLGLYVATVGIKATTESTVFLARKYFYGLVLAGLSWNAYQYYLNVQVYNEAEEAAEQAAEDADDGSGGGAGAGGGGSGLGPNVAPDYGSPYTAALGTLMIPMAVWVMCWFRAWEFQSLMVQAEEEATERARALTGGGRDRGAGGGGDEEEGGDGGADVEDEEDRVNDEEATDLEFSVQVEGRTIT